MSHLLSYVNVWINTGCDNDNKGHRRALNQMLSGFGAGL